MWLTQINFIHWYHTAAASDFITQCIFIGGTTNDQHLSMYLLTLTHLQGIQHALTGDNDLLWLFLNRKWANQCSDFLGRFPLCQLTHTTAKHVITLHTHQYHCTNRNCRHWNNQKQQTARRVFYLNKYSVICIVFFVFPLRLCTQCFDVNGQTTENASNLHKILLQGRSGLTWLWRSRPADETNTSQGGQHVRLVHSVLHTYLTNATHLATAAASYSAVPAASELYKWLYYYYCQSIKFMQCQKL